MLRQVQRRSQNAGGRRGPRNHVVTNAAAELEGNLWRKGHVPGTCHLCWSQKTSYLPR
ncbi:hypothetical protein AB7M16_002620 [Bradyrhizobium sp. USDA 372]